MTTLNFDEDEVDLERNTEPNEVVAQCPISAGGDSAVFHGSLSDSSVPSSSASNGQQFTVIAALPSTERLLTDLVRQTQENAVLLRQALAELHELKQQVQNQRKYPFTVKTCGFERELVLKAKEMFVTHGPWLVHGSLDKLKEKIAVLLGGADKVDAHHVASCVSYCKEKYTLWRADIRKKVLNRKLNHLKVNEFTTKLYAPFRTKEEDMKNADKTAMLLRKFASETGYFEDSTKSDFWDKFVDFANSWNKITIPKQMGDFAA
ncbi:hypothetical protein OS493_011275 [Desmophyllum pertusum]|uniref:Uncharacterized protein n=1 Tax=Desmophyllum pertusum TaxID=174260 RepID=A0A9W9Z1V5_9CNID|nr:hypothetical protein OS493_011275 [Desmophyllum pertusum]